MWPFLVEQAKRRAAAALAQRGRRGPEQHGWRVTGNVDDALARGDIYAHCGDRGENLWPVPLADKHFLQAVENMAGLVTGQHQRSPSHPQAYSECRLVMATFQPLLSPPITLNSGARTPSMKSSQNSAAPDICLIGRYCTPGSLNGRSTYDSPACLGASGSLRQSANIMVARAAPDVQTLVPVMTTSSSLTSARVCTPARSEP